MQRKNVRTGNKTFLSAAMLFTYGAFWTLLSILTIVLSPDILSSSKLVLAAQVASIFALIVSGLYIFAGRLIIKRMMSGAVLTFLLVIITVICNVALIVIGLGLLPFVSITGLLSFSFLFVGGLGVIINILIAMFLGSEWRSFGH